VATERKKLVIGTRGSKLALWQSEFVRGLFEDATGLRVEIKVIKTTGDKILDVPLAKVGGKGLFTKEIEVELAAGSVDLAVHSMKDVPTELPEGLTIAMMPPRVDPRDVIVSGAGYTLDMLPEGGTLGTSSLRRRSQVMALRPDLRIVDVRGNLDTRMRKAETGELDAVILAAAGIFRLGWEDRITHCIEPTQMVPAVGQGAIGVEIRTDDAFMAEVCAQLTHADTMRCVIAERVVMRRLEGGCQVPIGAYARVEAAEDEAVEGGKDKDGKGGKGGRLVMDAYVGSVDGQQQCRQHAEGGPDAPDALGEQMVEALLGSGAAGILAEIRDAEDVSGLC